MISCIVIGAGPGGLVSTKEMIEAGFDDVVCLEKAHQIGGTFATGYDSLLLTSSAPFSMFSDFDIGKSDVDHFWTKAEALDYWSRYADHFGVTPRLRLNAQVKQVQRAAGQGWTVTLTDGAHLHTARIILASGGSGVARYPDWASNLNAVTVQHAQQYKNAEPYRGKRVVVVGGGESGSDIALDIAKVAAQSWVSLRESTGWVVPRKRGEGAADTSTHRGAWGLPRSYGVALAQQILTYERSKPDAISQAIVRLNEKITAPNGIWGTYGTKSLGLPLAMTEYGCKVVAEITEVHDGGRQLRTADGEDIADVDAVVFCTGYRNIASYMPKDLQSCLPRTLYKQVFHPDMGTSLAFVGLARPCFGSQFPIMEMQARLCGEVFKGALPLPDPAEMVRAAKLEGDAFVAQLDRSGRRILGLVDYHLYMDGMAKLIGCLPSFGRLLLRDPRLWLHVVYGPTQASQFRLTGPGAKPDVARAIILRLPISRFNHMVKAGLRGRVVYALRALASGFRASWRDL